MVLGWVFLRDQLSLSKLADYEEQLVTRIHDYPLPAFGAAYLIYVFVTGLSIPGALILTLVYGRLFGFGIGTILVSLASTSGATLAFFGSRYLLRDFVQQTFGARLEKLMRAIESEGAFYLFTLRLIPQAPFFLINLAMGLTKMNWRTFWWVSQLGMLPGTCVYVFAGSATPSIRSLAEKGIQGILSWPLVVAFILLGVSPWIIKRSLRFFGKSATTNTPSAEDKVLS